MAEPHRYVPNQGIPADQDGNWPCVCGRAEPNQLHDDAAVELVDAAQAEHHRRIGDDR